MSTGAGRRVCPACAANNFDTQSRCWKCGADLASTVRPATSATTSSDTTSNQWAAAAVLGLVFPLPAVIVALVLHLLGDPNRARIANKTLGFAVAGVILHLVATPLAGAVLLRMTLAPLMDSITRAQSALPSTQANPMEELRRNLSDEP